MDSGTFRYLLGMAVHYALETQLLDVVTAYLYGNLDAIVYISLPPDFLPDSNLVGNQGLYSGLKLQKALYGLKQSGRMWYQHLREFLLNHKFQNDQALPCIFTLREKDGFVIIAIYVDDLNLVGTKDTTSRAIALLISKFEMKDLGKTSFCLGLQISHTPIGGILLHQVTYIRAFLKHFGMHQANPLSAPIMGRSKTSDDPYRPLKEKEEEYPDKTRYLAAVGALLYLSTYMRPDISFATSVLARHNQRLGVRHWSGVRYLLRYLRSTEDLGLYYTQGGVPKITSYVDAGFKSNKESGKS